MNFYELSKARCSIRRFRPEHISQEDLDYILQCGRTAPTAVNYQPQRILVLNTDEDCARLKRCGALQSHAPTALLVCYDTQSAWVRPIDGKCSGEIDAAIVQTQMMLAAAEIGVGSVWVMSFDPVKTREALNLPETYVPVSFLMLGYPAEDAAPAPMHRERLPEGDTVFYHPF